jgi:hypothetical protein
MLKDKMTNNKKYFLKDGGDKYHSRNKKKIINFKKEKIYNFKQALGHKKHLLDSGKYIEIFNYIRLTSKYQKIKTKNDMSLIWSDSILKKIEGFTHPILKP